MITDSVIAQMRDRESVQAVLRQRVDWQAGQQRLVVHFYRIRRRLTYPLPVVDVNEPAFPTSLSIAYPWNIWLMWALEDRLHALAWSARHDGQATHQRLVEDQLKAMEQWQRLSRDGSTPELMAGHLGKLLATVYQRWQWLSEDARQRVRRVAGRLVEDHWDWVDRHADDYAQPGRKGGAGHYPTFQ